MIELGIEHVRYEQQLRGTYQTDRGGAPAGRDGAEPRFEPRPSPDFCTNPRVGGIKMSMTTTTQGVTPTHHLDVAGHHIHSQPLPTTPTPTPTASQQ